MSRVWNFSAGPAALPRRCSAARSAKCWNGTARRLGDGATHRGKRFIAMARAKPRRICARCSHSGRLQGAVPAGRRDAAFRADPDEPRRDGDSADYIVTGHWGEKAASEAERYVRVNVAAASAVGQLHDTCRRARRWQARPATPLTCTTRPTKPSTAWSSTTIPDVGDVPLVADMSSDILSRPIDVSPLRPDLRRRAEEHRAVRTGA